MKQNDKSDSNISFGQKIKNIVTPNSQSLRATLLKALKDKTSQSESFSNNERTMLLNVLQLSNSRVEDVMVPRAEIEAIEESETIASMLDLFRSAAHSRLPIYDDNLDNIVGFIHIKDVVQHLLGNKKNGTTNGTKKVKLLTELLDEKIGSQDLVRKLIFVPPSMAVADLLQKMQATRIHMAMVIDEYGGTDGLVTIEDLLEVVVGDIEDEHDDEDGPLIKKIDENSFIADAKVELSEVAEMIGADFNLSDYVEDADSLGGLIFDLLDRVPVKGEVITKFKNFEFEILEADPRKIKKVCIRKTKRPTQKRTQKANISKS
ncbi:MAG: hemolysin family protein [Devosiaceae bacterium]|nr:hemolysin family protein [Devosiaceae bacterium]